MTIRIYKDPGGETIWKDYDLKDVKTQIATECGCEVIGGEGVKFTTT